LGKIVFLLSLAVTVKIFFYLITQTPIALAGVKNEILPALARLSENERV